MYFSQKSCNCHAELSCFPTDDDDPFEGQVALVVKILLLEISTVSLHKAA